MKKIVNLLFISIFVVVLVSGCGSKEKKEIEKENDNQETNESIIENQMQMIFSFKEENLIYKDGETTFDLVITNNDKSEKYLRDIRITFLNETGEKQAMTRKKIDNTFKAGESKKVKISIRKDLTKIEDISYEYFE